MSKGFLDAYNKTLGKEIKTPAKTTSGSSSITSEDMKAYVDAKITEMKNSLSNEMKQFFSNKEETVPDKVETPEETTNPQADNNNNIEKEGD